jgi:hypothetical protein
MGSYKDSCVSESQIIVIANNSEHAREIASRGGLYSDWLDPSKTKFVLITTHSPDVVFEGVGRDY